MKTNRKMLHAWIVASALVALAASPAAGGQAQGTRFSDAVITELVSGALDSDRVLRRQDISILTVGRVVYLRGYAGTLAQIDRAGAVARNVEGVSAVSNAIRVADRPSRARIAPPHENS